MMSRDKYVIVGSITLLIVVLCAYTVVSYTSPLIAKSIRAKSRSADASGVALRNRPIRIVIPSIKVNALIEEVGLTDDGAMDTPKNISNVGWFAPGTTPGAIGSAVMAGHYGWKDNLPSSFDRLSQINIGDRIYVVDDKQLMTTFVVRAIREYSPDDATSTIFNSSDGLAHLNLITCDGEWNMVDKSYSKRLVVFTDKTNE